MYREDQATITYIQILEGQIEEKESGCSKQNIDEEDSWIDRFVWKKEIAVKKNSSLHMKW